MDISGALRSKKVSCRTGIVILQLRPSTSPLLDTLIGK